MNTSDDGEVMDRAHSLLTVFRESNKSSVFQTKNREDFVVVSKALHTQRMKLIKELRETGKITQSSLGKEFNIRASVLKADADYKAKISKALVSVWNEFPNASDMSLSKDTTKYQEQEFKAFRSMIDCEESKILDSVLGSVAHLHVEIIGENKQKEEKLVSTFYATKYFEDKVHSPTHDFAVTNQSWLQGGTILWDADKKPIFQPEAGDVLFMPALTPHEPPIMEVEEDGSSKPRFMFIAEMRDIPDVSM